MSWKFPLVSRERLEDAQRQIEKLEAEKQKLLELLVPSLKGQSAQTPPVESLSDKQMAEWMPMGRPTVATIIHSANLEAQRRAEVPGAKPLSMEVQEKESARLRQTIGN